MNASTEAALQRWYATAFHRHTLHAMSLDDKGRLIVDTSGNASRATIHRELAAALSGLATVRNARSIRAPSGTGKYAYVITPSQPDSDDGTASVSPS